MRNLEELSINELLENCPTVGESINYFTNWYKSRSGDYGDTWKDENLMKELGEDYLNKFNALYKDEEVHDFAEQAEKEIEKQFQSNFTPFQHTYLIHALASKLNDEWNDMVEGIDEIVAGL